MPHTNHNKIPAWSWVAPAIALVLLGLKSTGLIPADHAAILIVSALLLGAAVFASVHHAEVLAVRLGEPFGSILLAVAVTIIEIGLIISIMSAGEAGSNSVARDTVFAAVMIVMNGVIGLCMVVGGRRHFEQVFQIKGASSSLAVLGTLAVITLVLPNYSLTEAGPFFSSAQIVVIGIASLVLYVTFVFVQTIRHRDYFLESRKDGSAPEHGEDGKPSRKTAWISLFLLMASLTAVILLSKILSKPISDTVAAAGLPKAFVGVVIALIVLLPEGIAAVRAAILNHLQNSINLAVGSAIASIGLTIPAVAVVSLMSKEPLALGINPANTVLLVLTLFMGTITLGTGRTTVLQGMVHLVIFAVFLMIAAVP
jgi:Ca2+:H+ antiporter